MSDAIRIATTVTPLESSISKTQSNTEAGRNPKDRRLPKRKLNMASELQSGLQPEVRDESTNELQGREVHQLDVII